MEPVGRMSATQMASVRPRPFPGIRTGFLHRPPLETCAARGLPGLPRMLSEGRLGKAVETGGTSNIADAFADFMPEF